ncbi:hypothetical protein E8E12_008035 [Didymella heteroderae]|uniref:Uncharacterized protein n=1 Tax=Didymella heteroderae TaxID=1769908 RepID=A0A9P5C3N0_9PLEO|nr:hypothetical protein E8E12_008035 [Didymella heteroderae]
MAWSVEAVIAFVTLLATCVPLGILLWRLHKHRSRRVEDRDVEEGIEPDKPQYSLPRTSSFVIVQALVRIS